ncbi:MAG: protease modulator HflC [Alphaproteobacteria bacterium]|nr:protease modulator HflC [Alphaproteobacteria bacterium]
MSRIGLLAGGISAVILLLFGLSCFYTVTQTEQALLLQFNAPREIVTDPGLHTKLPWVQSVVFLDKRLLNLEAPSEEVIAQDKKRLVVDAFARWRILDPLRFYQSLYDLDTAQIRLTSILSSNVRRVLGSQNFAAVLSARREELMRDIRDNMNQEARNFGIKIVDVRIRHADLPAENSQAIYNRMMQERKREANEYRAEGSEISQRIRARAEREVTVLLAEATRESSILRGQGDAEKTKILADAFGQDADFFAFYRSMQAYQEALPGENTTLVTSPNSDFFHFFSAPGGGGLRK